MAARQASPETLICDAVPSQGVIEMTPGADFADLFPEAPGLTARLGLAALLTGR
jgi:hypothetical protein